jgi:hypothetical protein
MFLRSYDSSGTVTAETHVELNPPRAGGLTSHPATLGGMDRGTVGVTLTACATLSH